MPGDYKNITDIHELRDVAAQLLEEEKWVGVDCETGYSGVDFNGRATDHSHPNQFTVGFSFTNSKSWGRYVPLRHDVGKNIPDEDAAWDAVRDLFTKGKLISHHSKFEHKSFAKSAGIVLADEGELIDTMLCVYVLNKWVQENGMRAIVDLKGIVLELFKYQMMHLHELFDNDLTNVKANSIRFNILNADDPRVTAYACEDAVWVIPLAEYVYPMAKLERPFMLELEHRISRMMVDVETYGVHIDWAAMEKAYAQAETFVPNMADFVKQGLGRIAGRDVSELNLNSSLQMKKLLYRDIGLETSRQTKGGKNAADKEDWERMSTDNKAMTALANKYPEVQGLLEYREVENLNRRLKKWLTEYNQAEDKRVHASYNQVTVGSGRFAANNPAIQQLPKDWYWKANDQEWSGNFRNFVDAKPGSYLLTFDLSQAELRMLAGDAQEPALLHAFANDIDPHIVTASQMLGKPIDEINKADRAIGKTFNFALLYGMGIPAMATQLGIEVGEADELYKKYFSAFSNIGSWMEKTVTVGREKGYAETVFGRCYHVWELQNPQRWIQEKGDRVLVNARIQGGVADMMKIGMLRAESYLKKQGWWGTKATVIMNQHDSLSFEVDNSIDPNELKAALIPLVSFGEEVVPVLKGYPAFRSDWEIGQQWGSSTKFDDADSAVFIAGNWTVLKEPRIEPVEDKSEIELFIPNGISGNQFKGIVEIIKANPGTHNVRIVMEYENTVLPLKTSATKEQLMEALV